MLVLKRAAGEYLWLYDSQGKPIARIDVMIVQKDGPSKGQMRLGISAPRDAVKVLRGPEHCDQDGKERTR